MMPWTTILTAPAGFEAGVVAVVASMVAGAAVAARPPSAPPEPTAIAAMPPSKAVKPRAARSRARPTVPVQAVEEERDRGIACIVAVLAPGMPVDAVLSRNGSPKP